MRTWRSALLLEGRRGPRPQARGSAPPRDPPRCEAPGGWRWLVVWMALATLANAAEPRRFEAVEAHMGTLVRIALYAEGEERAKAAFRAAFERIAELDAALSDYQPESELNRVCRAAVGKPVTVSGDLFRVLSASEQLSEESGGAFDVTLGPVIRLWRQARREQRLPSPEALRDAEERSGYRMLHLDAATQSVLMDRSGMQLDLGAIGKGYAADAALAVLAKQGITRALVAASGDLAFGDPPPGRRGWRIAIDSLEGANGLARVLELSNAAVSTSGGGEQHAEIGGRRYSHIVDPATGTGLTKAIAVTVVAGRGIEADSLATAVSVLGPERGMALIRERADAAAIAVSDGCVVKSPNWAELER